MTVSDNELARMLYPRPRDVVAAGTNGSDLVTVVTGRAASDSENGNVSVVLDADAMGVDAAVDVPTGAHITAGDDVLVTVSGNSPVDAVTAGWGDVLGDKVDSVTNYFWHDAQGAHVSTVEGDATSGPNVLVDSDSLDIREGTDVLASFDADGVHLYTADGTEIAYFTESAVKIGTSEGRLYMPYSSMYSNEGSVLWAISRGLTIEGHSVEVGNGNYATVTADPNHDPTTSGVGYDAYTAIEVMNALDGWASIGVKTDTNGTGDDFKRAEAFIDAPNVEFTGGELSYSKTMDDFIRDLYGAVGVTLYESTSGTNSTITIGDYDFSDFDHITILYGKLDGSFGGYQSQTVYNPDGKRVVLSQSYAPVVSSGTVIQVNTSVWSISGNQITPVYNGRYANIYLYNGTVGGNQSGDNRILIYRVVGYSTKAAMDATTGDYTAGDGISISGNVISADVTTSVLNAALDDYVPVVDTMSYADIQAILV